MERERLQSDDLLRIAGRMARFGGWIVDLDEGIVDWSDEVCAIHDEPPGTRVPIEKGLDYYVPEWRPVIEERFFRCVREGVPYDLELELLTRRGRRVWVRTIGEPVEDDHGRIRWVQGAFQDVTRWRATEAALRTSESLFRQIAENVESVFWISPPDRSRFEYVSPAYRQLWQRDPGPLLEDAAVWLESIHPDDREAVRTAVSRGGKAGFDLEYRIIRPDGSQRWIWDRAFPLSGQDGSAGSPDRIVGIAEDVTERRELDERLRHSQKLEVVGQLAGGIAHDFNNLLTVIRASSEMLAEDLPSGSDLRETTEEIRTQAERGARLTRQLLAFSRRQVMEEQVLDLAGLLAEMQPTLRRLIPENIDVSWTPSREPLRVRADPDQLQQVVLNLVVNAVDAIEGHGRIAFTVDEVLLSETESEELPWESEAGTYVRLTVEDTGHGMTPDVIARLFEPFFTTKPVGQGTGLGLPMVYGVVKQSGGHVLVESEPGKGSIFRILLPRTEKAGEAPGQVRARSAPAIGSGTVLVVEDDEAVRTATARLLGRAGYRVLEAAGGQEALDLVEGTPVRIDAVVSDVVMRDMDGVHLLERLRRLRPDLPVVLMSGYSDEELSAEARRIATVFVEKPFDPGDLGRAVEKAIQTPPPDRS